MYIQHAYAQSIYPVNIYYICEQTYVTCHTCSIIDTHLYLFPSGIYVRYLGCVKGIYDGLHREAGIIIFRTTIIINLNSHDSVRSRKNETGEHRYMCDLRTLWMQIQSITRERRDRDTVTSRGTRSRVVDVIAVYLNLNLAMPTDGALTRVKCR